MKLKIFQFISELENDISAFYERLKTISRLNRSAELFEYMSEHSRGHSNTVFQLENKYSRPELDNSMVSGVFEQIKSSLMKEIINAKDMHTAMEKIAKTEELVGKMYIMMAKYYSEMSQYYKSIQGEIEKIAGEEFVHRDMVLGEADKYRER